MTTPPTAPATSGHREGGRLIRLSGGAALLALAGITAVISYQHGLDVVQAAGSTGLVAYLVPLVADLLIFASSLALLDAAQNNMPRPALAVVSLAFGIVATVAMNVAAGWRHGTGGALVSALAPVALVLSYETLMGMVRRARQRADLPSGEPDAGQIKATGGQCPHKVAGSVDEAVRTAFLHGRDCLRDKPSQRHLSRQFGISRDKVAELVPELKKSPAAERHRAPAEAAAPATSEPAQHTPNGQR